VVFLRLAFWPHSYDLTLAEGYPHEAQAGNVQRSRKKDRMMASQPTFVLPMEGAVPAAPAESVGLGVSLTVDWVKCKM